MTDFWCEACRDWTLPAPRFWGGGVRCYRCGENYQCGECGSEIDDQGNCLREEGCR